MTRRSLPSSLLVAIVFSACSTPPDLAEAEASLRAADETAKALVLAKDAPGLVDLLADDATNYPPNAAAATGKEAFRTSFEQAFALPGFAVAYPESSKVVVGPSGEWGYTTSPEEFTITGADGERVTLRSRYLAVWRRAPDGNWRIVENIWNFSEPLPAEAGQ